jgi:hypothetical protein
MLTDWLEGMDLRTKEAKKVTAVAKAAKCCCCRKERAVKGNRGRCDSCHSIYLRDKASIKNKRAQAAFEQKLIDDGLLLPKQTGGRPRLKVPGRVA